MKKNIRTAAFYIATAVFTVFTSCSSDNANVISDSTNTANATVETQTENEDYEPNVDGVSVEITDSACYTINEMADKMFGPDGANSSSENEELRQKFLEIAHAEEKELQNEYGANNGLFYKSVTYKYKSTDLKGNAIELSAEVSWKRFAWWPIAPKNIILGEHYTVANDSWAPSEYINYMQTLVGNNLFIQPDYIGYGTTKNEIHPYLNHDITAINSVDALEAGYLVWKKETKNKKNLRKGWKMFVTGSSQGGSSALAVHKYLDTHLDVANKWRFAYSFCCCGPYSPTATMEGYYKDGAVSYPCVIPMTLKSMMASYPEILGKYKEDDFYSEKYLKIKNIIDGMLSSKEFKTDAIIKKMKTLLGVKGDKINLKDILSDSILDRNSEIAKDFFLCLDKNDLTKGWTPVHEIRLYQSKGDEVVPYANAEKLKQAFPGKVKEERVFEKKGHVGTCMCWMLSLPFRTW